MRRLDEVAEEGVSKDRGRGIFARSRIAAGERLDLVEEFQLLSVDAVRKLPHGAASLCYDYELKASLNVCPKDFGAPALSFLMNHSCQPNTVSDDNWDTLIALHAIALGEEITREYATAVSDPDPQWNFRCSCGALNCRNAITGNDWMIPELQERYRGYFQRNIQEKVDALRRSGGCELVHYRKHGDRGRYSSTIGRPIVLERICRYCTVYAEGF